MSILLTILGFIKSGFAMLLGFLKAIMDWARANPITALIVSLAIVCAGLGYWGNNQREARIAAEASLKEQKELNQKLNASLKQYVKALDDEKKLHVQTIKNHNAAVQKLKDEADKAASNAAKEANRIRAERDKYLDVAAKYSNPNNSSGTAEERIAREQRTNDQFFKDFKAGTK